MNVGDLMTTPVQSCTVDDSLQRAAQLMWEGDCGAIPVVDGDGRVIGMVTDRDACMAAYTRGQALWEIPVSAVMTREVHAVRESDGVEDVTGIMKSARVRRVPVLDGGQRLVGILSMNDLARHAQRAVGRSQKANGLSADSIAQTLAAICEPHAAPGRSATA
ncbi:MAG: CBS domain-containing protein [Polyangiaceae bacterium]